MISVPYAIAMIGVTAVCTLITRALPFLIFSGKKKAPEFINYLGEFLPPAIMVTLVVYCLKNTQLFSGNHGLPEIISVAVTAGLHIWKKNILLTVAAGTICYMVLVQFVFV